MKERAKLGDLDGTRVRSRIGKLEATIYNVRALSLAGLNEAVNAKVRLQKFLALDCDVIVLQERRRPGRAVLAAAGCRICCYRTEGG